MGKGEHVADRQLVDERSMGTYLGASAAVIVIWQVIKAMVTEKTWWALIPAGFAALTLVALAPKKTGEERAPWRTWVIAIFFFVANTAMLASAALGIGETADQISGTTSSNEEPAEPTSPAP